MSPCKTQTPPLVSRRYFLIRRTNWIGNISHLTRPLKRISHPSGHYARFFLKIENLNYRSLGGVKNKAPRIISGAQPQFICNTMQFFQAFQKKLKTAWHPNFPITFASGMDGEGVGKWLSKRLHKKYLYEDDVSLWDVSVQHELLVCEAMIYDWCGAPPLVSQLVWKNIRTRAKSRWGIRYTTPDGRKSGDPYTSCGNSLLNGLLHLYIYCTVHNLSVADALRECSQIVMGDDNMIACDRETDFQGWMLKFGFKSELVRRRNWRDLEFCSSRPVPFKDGIVMLPILANVMNKFGIYPTSGHLRLPYQELVACAAKGLYNTLCFHPQIKRVFDQYTTDRVVERPAWQLWCSRPHEPTPDTWATLDHKMMNLSRLLLIDSETRWFNHKVQDFHSEITTGGPRVWARK